MTACPKCGYVRKPSDTAPDWQCPSCGVAYAKIHAAVPPGAAAVAPAAASVSAQLIVESEEGLRWYALGAIAWVGFVAFILTGLFTTFKEAPFISVLFFGVFLLIALVAARKGLSGLGAYMNFGTVQVALARAPAAGGELKGCVAFEAGAAALAKIEAEFVCVQEFTSMKNRNARAPQEVFSEKAVLEVHAGPGQRRAFFAFAVPAYAKPSGEAEESTDEGLRPNYKWMLRVKAPNAGGELARSFPLEMLPAGAAAEEPPSQEPAAETAIALVVANLIPLALVLLGWGSVGSLVVLYWAENVVIGCYTVLRMLESGRGAAGEKIGKSIFFCFHYGMFCLVHGVFVMTLFLSPEQHAAHRAMSQGGTPFGEIWFGAQAVGLFSPRGLLLPLLALAVSHGVSFYTNYLRNGRYRTSSPQDSFMRPYPRMILLHVFIIAGGFFIAGHGSTMLPLAALVIGKTLMDLGLHRRSNRAG